MKTVSVTELFSPILIKKNVDVRPIQRGKPSETGMPEGEVGTKIMMLAIVGVYQTGNSSISTDRMKEASKLTVFFVIHELC